MANKNRIGQKINDAITVSKETGLPVLFMGNPGVGKTTHVREWAESNGYHLEILIGSRNTAEEIMGYQVNNGGKSLDHLNPGWWKRIMEYAEKGIPTLVFVDELSVCPENVQGSILSLICDRENSEGEKLPEGTLLIAAANYAGNLPSMMNIMTPTMNRFVIVNILDGLNNLEILEEFLTECPKAIQHKVVEIAKEKVEEINADVFEFFKNLLVSYSDRDSSKGWLDFANTNLGNIYQDCEGSLYQLMSPRSCSYLQRLVVGFVKTGINENQIVADMCSGLVGLGTATFTDDSQGVKFRRTVATSVKSIINKHLSAAKPKKSVKDLESASLADAIHEFMMNKEAADDLTDASAGGLVDVFQMANAQYGDIIKVAQRCEKIKQLESARYVSDIEALQELIEHFVRTDVKSPELEKLVRIHQDNYYIYCNLVGTHCDLKAMKDVYGPYTPKLASKIVVLKLKSSARQPAGYCKAGVRMNGKNWLAFKMDLEESAQNISLSNSIYKDDIEATVNPKVIEG